EGKVMSNIQDAVKEKYGAAAKQVAEGKTACCGGGAELSGCDPITRNLYDAAEKAGLPAAKRVGPTGKAYGLDMTDEMLALARANQKKAGVENVEFLKGAIENIPL